MLDIIQSNDFLSLTFAFLMGLAILIYCVLDGYDLGVGILTRSATHDEKDYMISSIGPFWDANETWLVLGVGILLIAFPKAHGIILSSLYLPVLFMLLGLMVRGVAFEFRIKTDISEKEKWNMAFFSGSLLTTMSQGFMIGQYIIGFKTDFFSFAFASLVACCAIAGYCLIGSAWLIMKTEGDLQKKSVHWARLSLFGTIIGIALVSIATPLVSTRIFDKWFIFPNILYLIPIPFLTGTLVIFLERFLRKLPMENDQYCWVPFVSTIAIYILCFFGLAYSFYPYIIPNELKIIDAASAPESLFIILIGTLIVLPILILYTFVSYRVFHGKATKNLY